MGNMNADPKDPHGYSPTPPYPSHFESDRFNTPQPQVPPAASSVPNMEPYPVPPHPQNTGYLNDAVSSAIHSADSSAYLSPDVLSQITATVIQQLKASSLDNVQGSAAPSPRSQSQQPPYSAAEYPPRPHSESPPMASQSSEPVPSTNPMANSYDNSQSYAATSGYASDTRPNPKPSPDPLHRRHDSMPSHGSRKPDARPKPPSRDATVMEMTTLEKIWGKLFEDGKPTKRLGQFLRGIALHLVGLLIGS